MDQSRERPSQRQEKQLRALQIRRRRRQEERFLAEGVRVVEDLLASALEVEWLCVSSALEDNGRGAALLRAAEARRLEVRQLPEREFAVLAATEQPQGVVAVVKQPRVSWPSFEGAGAGTVVLLLDGVQDPGNLGTLVRTAEALGIGAVVALPGTVDPWNPKVVRAAAGSLFRVPVIESGWDEAVEVLRAAGFRLLGAEVGGVAPAPVSGLVGLVLGNEGAGLSERVRGGVDGVLGIPLRGRAESLNVAAAAAILLYELTR